MGVAGINTSECFCAKSKSTFCTARRRIIIWSISSREIQAKIERDLVVAAAPGVQFGTRRSDPFSQHRLDVYVHVFQRRVPDGCSGGDFVFDLAQAGGDHLKFIGGENPGAGESRGVCDRPGNVVAIEAAIERNRLVVTLSDFGRGEENLPSLMITSLALRERPSLKHNLHRAKQICALQRRPCGQENA